MTSRTSGDLVASEAFMDLGTSWIADFQNSAPHCFRVSGYFGLLDIQGLPDFGFHDFSRSVSFPSFATLILSEHSGLPGFKNFVNFYATQ